MVVSISKFMSSRRLIVAVRLRVTILQLTQRWEMWQHYSLLYLHMATLVSHRWAVYGSLNYPLRTLDLSRRTPILVWTRSATKTLSSTRPVAPSRYGSIHPHQWPDVDCCKCLSLIVCQVSFSTSIPLRATSNLILTSGNQDYTEYILQQFRDNTLSFQIRLPKAGIYKFQVRDQCLCRWQGSNIWNLWKYEICESIKWIEIRKNIKSINTKRVKM